MSTTIHMDAAGRLVLPKAVRERLSLFAGASLRAEVVAGRVELTPVASDGVLALGLEDGVLVLKGTGSKVDAARAVAEVREEQGARGLRR